MNRKLFLLLALVSFFLIAWEVVSQSYEYLRFIIPAPTAIFSQLWEKSSRFLLHTSVTLKEMLSGILLAFLAAFPLAWCMTNWKPLRKLLQPFFVVTQCLPMFVLAPIMVLWFGWSFTAILVPTALMIFFPLTMTLYQGFVSVPIGYLNYFELNSATLWQKFIKLQLPWARPHLFSGLRISAAIAGIGAVAGEWAGGQQGLGVLMLESRRSADLETCFAALFCLTALSLMLYGAVVLLEKLARRPRDFIKASLALICMIALLSGCHSSSKTQTRLLLDWFPNPNHVPLFAGLQKGFFEEQGIELQLISLPDAADSVPYLTSGQADVALYYTPYTMRAQLNGAPIIPIATLVDKPLDSIIFRKGELEKIADLNGKVLGVPFEIPEVSVLDALLADNRIRPKARYLIGFNLVTALGTKHVDAITGAFWNIEAENLNSLGIPVSFFTFSELGIPNYAELIFIAKSDVSEDFKQRFIKALQKCIEFSQNNAEEAFEIYAKANPDKSSKTLAWEKAAWYQTLAVLSQDPKVNQEQWTAFETWLKSKRQL